MSTLDSYLDLSALRADLPDVYSSLKPSPDFTSLLPPELKLKIIDELANELHEQSIKAYDDPHALETRCAPLDFSVRQLRHRYGRPTSIANLSLVSREWHALCAPYLWKDVDLVHHSCMSLLFFYSKICPRYGKHVRTLSLGAVLEDESSGRCGEPKAEQTRLFTKVVEDYRKSMSNPNELTPRIIKEAFMATAISRCPAVEAVHIGVLPSSGRSPALSALLKVAPAWPLKSLSLICDRSSTTHVRAFTTLLDKLPHLERLSLTLKKGGNAPASALPRITRAVSSLTHLTSLSLVAPATFFPLLDLQSPILHLEIRSSDPPKSTKPFAPLFRALSPTLKTLRVHNIFDPHTVNLAASVERLTLPAMEHLRLDMADFSPFLVPSLFHLPSLSFLSLEDWTETTALDLLPFIPSAPSLKTVFNPCPYISCDSWEDADEIEDELCELSLLCSSRGIEVKDMPDVESLEEEWGCECCGGAGFLPSPSPSNSPLASLSLLPPELKLKIVEEVAAEVRKVNGEDSVGPSELDYEAEQLRRTKKGGSTLAKLSDVSREWYWLCCPLLPEVVDPSRASLSLLPPEIKLQIVEEVVHELQSLEQDRTNTAELDFSLKKLRNEQGRLTTLANLSLISREWHALGQLTLSPRHNVDFIHHSCYSIVCFLTDIISRRGQHIRKLFLDSGTDSELFSSHKSPTATEHNVLDHAVAKSGGLVFAASGPDPQKIKELFLAAVAQACPKVQAAHSGILRKREVSVFFFAFHEAFPSWCIITFGITCSIASANQAKAFVDLAVGLSQRKRLSLTLRKSRSTSRSTSASFAATVESFQELTALSVSAPASFSPLLVVEVPLLHLQLQSPDSPIAFEPFVRLLQTVSSTLMTLRMPNVLRTTVSSVSPYEAGEPLVFPALIHLHLGAADRSPFIIPALVHLPAPKTLNLDVLTENSAIFLRDFVLFTPSLSTILPSSSCREARCEWKGMKEEAQQELSKLVTVCKERGIAMGYFPGPECEDEQSE
ncbi:hypothetical protein JCM8547_006007 [Rhodosporidiobolus lusitaniae]